MSLPLIADQYVLFPHPPNYTTAPEWSRRWETDVSESVTGAESRQAMRATPLVSLSWTVTPWSLQQQAQLDDQIRAAKKIGYACAPYWGRASVLQSKCTTAEVILQSAHWPWAVYDYLFLLDASDPAQPIFNLRQITAVDDVTLTLDANVSNPFPAGTLVWPLIFGKFETEEMAVQNLHRGEARLKITELFSPQNQSLGFPSGADGIGQLSIGDTFEIQ